MALGKIDAVKFESLSQTLSMLLQHGTDRDMAKTMLGQQISDLESSSKHMIKFVTRDDDSLVLEALDLSKDFVRTRKPNSETQVLRAKIQGIAIDVKLFKEDDFKFSNGEAVSALRALANEVEELNVELNTLGVSNVRMLDSDSSDADDVDVDDADADADADDADTDAESNEGQDVNGPDL